MLKDHDETNVQTDLAPVPSIDNLNEITFNDNSKGALEGISGGVQNESSEARSLQVNDPKMRFIDIQIQNENTDYLNIPLNGKWLPSVNSVHIGHNFRTMTNMRYTKEHPVSVMGMSRINTTSFGTYPINMFHYAKAAVVNSLGSTIRNAESHLIIQGYSPSSGNFVLKQNTTAIPNQGNFSGTQLYPSVGSKIYHRAGSFSTCPNDGMVFCYGQEDAIWDGDESRVPAFLRCDAVAIPPANPTDYTNRINNSIYTADEYVTLETGKVYLIGTTRPLNGINVYSWNTVADCFGTFKYYKGGSWENLTATYTGDTYKAGYTFTAPTDGVRAYIEGYFLYWYAVATKAAGVGIKVYHVTLSSPMGSIENTWDGNFLEIASCIFHEGFATSTDMSDITLNVLNIDDYLTEDKTSHFEVENYTGNDNDMDSTDCIYVGFTKDVCGLYIDIPRYDGDDFSGNTKASVMRISYWTGSAWQDVVVLNDGTSESGATLNHTGVVFFDPVVSAKKSILGGNNLNYFRIRSSATAYPGVDSNADVDSDTRINYIGGIPAPEPVSGHSFAVHAADRLMLGCNAYENKNELLISAQDRPEVFNGTDSLKIKFGGTEALTCAAPVFAQYASNIYNIILVFKAKETWILQWNQSSSGTSWSRFCVSPTVGCPAPKTLRTASVNFENDINQSKNIAIWRGHDGIYISNGQSPFCVSEDIKHVFDENNLLDSSLRVNRSVIYMEAGFVDEDKHEYHWLWASGNSTTLNKEYVLDLREWKWFEINRNATGGSQNELQSGVTVSDTSGNKYAYGGILSYLERLEHGATFDSTTSPYTNGDKIESTLRFGELVPYKNPAITSSLKRMFLTCVPKETDTSITMTHYRDGDATGTSSAIQMDETLDIDVSPSEDWVAGDIITGQTSGETCVVVSKISATTYKVKERSGTFTLGEIIGVTGNSSKLANQGAAHPVFLISTNDFVMMTEDIGSQDASFHGLKFYHESTVSTKGFEPLTLSLEIQKGREK